MRTTVLDESGEMKVLKSYNNVITKIYHIVTVTKTYNCLSGSAAID